MSASQAAAAGLLLAGAVLLTSHTGPARARLARLGGEATAPGPATGGAHRAEREDRSLSTGRPSRTAEPATLWQLPLRLRRHLPRHPLSGPLRRVLAAAAVALGWALLGAPALLLAGGVAAARWWLGARRASRNADRERARAVEACVALAGELRAGRQPADALEVAAAVATGPSGAALRSAASAARLGSDVPGALTGSGARASAVPEVLRGLAACWRVCSTAGSGLAAAVERLAEAQRAAEAQRRLVESELAGPRATAGLLALLPLAGIALGAGLGAEPLSVLLHTPLGLGCLVLGLGLDGLGLWWTARIVRHAAGRP